MRCCNCPYYKSGYQYNACILTESEYFQKVDACELVNDDGSINYSNEWFSTIEGKEIHDNPELLEKGEP